MDVKKLAQPGSTYTIDRQLRKLVATIASADFDLSLLEFAREATKSKHVSGFIFAPQPRMLLAASDESPRSARRCAERYISDYWTLDPANSIEFQHSRDEHDHLWTVRMSFKEIDDTAYKRDCYNSVGVVDRFSVLRTTQNSIIRINFYRGVKNGPFENAETELLSSLAGFLVSIVERHDQLSAGGRESVADTLYERLIQIAPPLSPREVDVCAGIIDGLSSEGIALKYNLSINTILTHRKNAYSKLKISSQNELLHMLYRRNLVQPRLADYQ